MAQVQGERLHLVCQYCYSPVVLGRPAFLDDRKLSATYVNNYSTSPSKNSKFHQSASTASLGGGGASKRGTKLSPVRMQSQSPADEFSRRSPEEAFEAFQKVLLELEKENEQRVNPRLRVTSLNPVTLVPLQSYVDMDDSFASSKTDTENAATSDESLLQDANSENNSRKAEQATSEVNNHQPQITGVAVDKEAAIAHRTPVQHDNLLPYSKETVDAVFDSLSECSALDFPICCSCADQLVENLDVKAQLLTRECRALVEQKQEEEQKLAQICPEEELDQMIAQLENEESSLLDELKQLENEKENLEESNRMLDLEEKKLSKQEAQLSIENNELQHEIYSLETSLKSVSEQVKFAEDHFNALKKTNVFNLVFNIWHHDHKFGTINGFRLGKLNETSGGKVEWSEINMALGQSCLLLHCLIAKLNFQPNGYTLVPCGARSYIEQNINNGGVLVREKLNLFSEGGNKFFYDSSIDNAMKAFLNVLDQFRANLEHKNSEFRLPYPMKGEFIFEKQGSDIGYSVCPGKTTAEMWTKACRLMLANLKWGIVGVCTISAHPSDWLQPQNGDSSNEQLRGRANVPGSHNSNRSNFYISNNMAPGDHYK